MPLDAFVTRTSCWAPGRAAPRQRAQPGRLRRRPRIPASLQMGFRQRPSWHADAVRGAPSTLTAHSQEDGPRRRRAPLAEHRDGRRKLEVGVVLQLTLERGIVRAVPIQSRSARDRDDLAWLEVGERQRRRMRVRVRIVLFRHPCARMHELRGDNARIPFETEHVCGRPRANSDRRTPFAPSIASIRGSFW